MNIVFLKNLLCSVYVCYIDLFLSFALDLCHNRSRRYLPVLIQGCRSHLAVLGCLLQFFHGVITLGSYLIVQIKITCNQHYDQHQIKTNFAWLSVHLTESPFTRRQIPQLR